MKVKTLATDVAVELAADVESPDVLRALALLHPRTEGPASTQFVLRRDAIVCNGQVRELLEPRDVVPRFEVDLYREAIASAPPGWLLHAAAVEVDGRAIILCGRSGSGKTTTTLNLVARGLRMLSEELVWIDPHGLVHGLRRPLHRTPDDHLPVPDHWPAVRYDLRTRTGELVTETMVLPPPDAYVPGPLPLHTVVRLGHGPDWPSYLRASDPTTALQRLWDQAMRHDEADLAVATRLLHDRVTYELSSRTPGEALSLLDSLLK